jgi:hypothetical protein
MTKPYPGLPGFDPGEPLPPAKRAWQHSLIDNHEFLTDCARYIEGLYSREQVKRRWRNIDDATWDLLGGYNELVDAISAESLRRVRDGSAKRISNAPRRPEKTRLEKFQLLILVVFGRFGR